ncbi:uncharacterized protein LOC136764548 [Amia ocellicauda]|uniref:uncharacterized protein LOC136764548 n=1 Tax=Amia ocellicauda TaxID=2972642 RepID=UPI0034643C95
MKMAESYLKSTRTQVSSQDRGTKNDAHPPARWLSGQLWGSALGAAGEPRARNTREKASTPQPLHSAKERVFVIKEEPIDTEEPSPESLLTKAERYEENSASSDPQGSWRIVVNRAVQATALPDGLEMTPVKQQPCDEDWDSNLRQETESTAAGSREKLSEQHRSRQRVEELSEEEPDHMAELGPENGTQRLNPLRVDHIEEEFNHLESENFRECKLQ